MEKSNNSHIVLARKYRPRKLEELVGQDVFVKTISNAINTNKLHHAFLLTGTRGVGKTSSARILALSLNCKKYNKPTLTPCLECDCCKATLEGCNPDIIEFDAASNTGKDDIHETIIDKINFAPMMSRYKVYIIDEVHMLSKSAFNALLKTLEEPPEKVKFVFATTEVNKVPITILSRCQKFYLKNVPSDTILEHLKHICSLENINYDEDSLKIISKYANGSIRDGLSLLDQAVSIGNNNVDKKIITEMLSIPDKQMVAKLFYDCYIGDIANALRDMECFISNEIEVINIINEILDIILDGLKVASCIITTKDITFEYEEQLNNIINADNLNIPRLIRMWQILINSLQEIKVIQSKQYFTALVYKLCYTSTLPTPIETLKLITNEKLKKTTEIIQGTKIIK